MVAAEIARVEAAGGWVADGRVCDVIAVSRAFGDMQFKEEAGRRDMLKMGLECAPPLLHPARAAAPSDSATLKHCAPCCWAGMPSAAGAAGT